MLAIRAVPTFALAMVALMLATWAVPARADCQIEDWRWNYDFPGLVANKGFTSSLAINGTTTCEEGRITIRAYDGEQFIGATSTLIRGYVFDVLITNVHESPRSLKIKHTIKQR